MMKFITHNAIQVTFVDAGNCEIVSFAIEAEDYRGALFLAEVRFNDERQDMAEVDRILLERI